MKKLCSLILAAAMALSLAACGTGGTGGTGGGSSSSNGDSSTVTVTGRDALGEDIQVEVPYKPEKVVVLDLANLDILDNLGLGDCVVGAPTITLPYLQS